MVKDPKQTNPTKFHFLSNLKKPILILTSLVVFVILISVIITLTLAETPPKNLGDKLEYVGKRDYSCLLCSEEPVEYYFATDIPEEELDEYFTRATIESKPSIGASAEYQIRTYKFVEKSSGKDFYISYVRPSDVVVDLYNLKESEKKYLLSMDDASYRLAEQSR